MSAASKRRWNQVSLKTLFLMTSAVAVYCGIAKTIWALTDWGGYVEWTGTYWKWGPPAIWYQILQSGVDALGIVVSVLLVTYFVRGVYRQFMNDSYRNNLVRTQGKKKLSNSLTSASNPPKA